MANRYWVGGTGSWSDDENHWATSSGGSGGIGNLPTAEDNVFIDDNSGVNGETITIDIAETPCLDFTDTCTSSYTLTGAEGLYVFGSLLLGVGVSLIDFGGFAMMSSEIDETITTNGAIVSAILFIGSGKWTLQDNLVCEIFISYGGTFDANDHNVTAGEIKFSAVVLEQNVEVIMGSGTWELTGSDFGFTVEDGEETSVTITPETSTIKITGTAPFVGGGKTYNNLWITAPDCSVSGSNTFNDLTIDAGLSVLFEATKTQTINGTPYLTGTDGNLIVLDAIQRGIIATGHISTAGSGYTVDDELTWDDAVFNVDSVDGGGAITGISIVNGGINFEVSNEGVLSGGTGGGTATFIVDTLVTDEQFILSKASGTISCDYLDLSNSNATGGASWYAGENSEDTINNDGWIFTTPPDNFFMFF